MITNPVRWFEIYVQDMSRARKFYEGVLNVTLEKLETPDSMSAPGCPSMELWAFPMQKGGPGCSGALVRLEGVPSGACGTLVYFSSEDCAVETARVKQFGGSIHRDKFSIGQYGYIALACDTEGNLIGLHSLT